MLTFPIVPQETSPEYHTRPDAGRIALSGARIVVYPEHMTEQADMNPAGGGGDLPREPKPGVSDEVLEFAARLFDMAREGDTAQLAGYIDAGVSPELTNERGDAFLMLAAYNGNLETVQMLVDRGVDVNKLNDRGQTPLAGAVFKGYGEIVKALFEAGANPHKGQPTAVEAAAMFEKDAFLELFGRE